MTSSATSSALRTRVVPVVVPVGLTKVTGTRLRFTRECFRTEPLSREGESGLEAEVGAQTRGEGGGKGADQEDGGQNLPREGEGQEQGPGLEEEQLGQDLGTGPGPGRGEGEGEDEAQDRRGEEVKGVVCSKFLANPSLALRKNSLTKDASTAR